MRAFASPWTLVEQSSYRRGMDRDADVVPKQKKMSGVAFPRNSTYLGYRPVPGKQAQRLSHPQEQSQNLMPHPSHANAYVSAPHLSQDGIWWSTGCAVDLSTVSPE